MVPNYDWVRSRREDDRFVEVSSKVEVGDTGGGRKGGREERRSLK